MYAKSAMGCLLEMRYQVRMGIIGACDQGVPQARNRQALIPTPLHLANICREVRDGVAQHAVSSLHGHCWSCDQGVPQARYRQELYNHIMSPAYMRLGQQTSQCSLLKCLTSLLKSNRCREPLGHSGMYQSCRTGQE